MFVYLSDILTEIEFLKSASAGLTFEQYLKSGEKRRAIERSLEIISEEFPKQSGRSIRKFRGAAFKTSAMSFVTLISGSRKNAYGRLFKRSSANWNGQSASFNLNISRVEQDHSAACRSTV